MPIQKIKIKANTGIVTLPNGFEVRPSATDTTVSVDEATLAKIRPELIGSGLLIELVP